MSTVVRSRRPRVAARGRCWRGSRCIRASIRAARSRRASGPTSWIRAPAHRCAAPPGRCDARSAPTTRWSSGRDRIGLRCATDVAEFDAHCAAGRLDEAVALCPRPAARRPRRGLGPGGPRRARRTPRRGARAAGRDGPRPGRGGRLRTAPPGARPARRSGGPRPDARLVEAGDRSAALATYTRLADRLRTNLGLAASAETRALAASVREAEPAERASLAAATTRGADRARRRAAGTMRGADRARWLMAAATPRWGRPRWPAAVLRRTRQTRCSPAVASSRTPARGACRRAGRAARRVGADVRGCWRGRAAQWGGRDRQDAARVRSPRPRGHCAHRSRHCGRSRWWCAAVRALGRVARRASRASSTPPPAAAEWPEELGRLAPSLPRRLGRAAAKPSDVPPDLARARLFEAAVELAEHATLDRPLVLLIDDVHLADAPTLELAAYLARRIRDLPVLLVLTRRTVPRRDAVDALLHTAKAERRRHHRARARAAHARRHRAPRQYAARARTRAGDRRPPTATRCSRWRAPVPRPAATRARRPRCVARSAPRSPRSTSNARTHGRARGGRRPRPRPHRAGRPRRSGDRPACDRLRPVRQRRRPLRLPARAAARGGLRRPRRRPPHARATRRSARRSANAAESAHHLKRAGRDDLAAGRLVQAAADATRATAILEAAAFLREAAALDPSPEIAAGAGRDARAAGRSRALARKSSTARSRTPPRSHLRAAQWFRSSLCDPTARAGGVTARPGRGRRRPRHARRTAADPRVERGGDDQRRDGLPDAGRGRGAGRRSRADPCAATTSRTSRLHRPRRGPARHSRARARRLR